MCDATCSAIGMAHYLTFDGLKYLFPGECQYVLVQVRAREGEPAVCLQEALGDADCPLGVSRSDSTVLSVETALGLVSTGAIFQPLKEVPETQSRGPSSFSLRGDVQE